MAVWKRVVNEKTTPYIHEMGELIAAVSVERSGDEMKRHEHESEVGILFHLARYAEIAGSEKLGVQPWLFKEHLPNWIEAKGLDKNVPLASFAPIRARPMREFVSPPLNYHLLAACNEKHKIVALDNASRTLAWIDLKGKLKCCSYIAQRESG